MKRKRKKFGDRKEGRLLHSIPAYNRIIPFFLPTRAGSSVYFEETVRIDEIDDFLRSLRVQGYGGIDMMHYAIACYLHTLAMYPGINRFVAGQRIYARNTIDVGMTVKRGMALDSGETTIKICFEPNDTLIDVYNKMNEQIKQIKNSPESNGTEVVARVLCSFPRFITRFLAGLIKFGDYYDILPVKLIDASPFHASLMITNLASLGIGPVYHHLYEIGNIPVFLGIGSKKHVYELNSEGKPESAWYMTYKFVVDERIVDGAYYAAFFRELKETFLHPNVVMEKPKNVLEDWY